MKRILIVAKENDRLIQNPCLNCNVKEICAECGKSSDAEAIVCPILKKYLVIKSVLLQDNPLKWIDDKFDAYTELIKTKKAFAKSFSEYICEPGETNG